ncbi:MAG TPA: glycoside hydrolase family 38 C-terminal domain-containing protein, partial [Ktedonobacterales bacterium]|nr:glycoside hydrolase family 38 C-terminal domain-containing protein [Ktedonobacterales bacterium]
WHEHHLLLKAAFPLDLRTTQARSEIQYGSIERATHRNTSWDQARFETCAHRWIDLSEADYGVSLLNDGRYGHDIHDTTVRLSLLRSATSPDPDADQGEHVFTYCLSPHLGDWRTGGAIPAAYALNRQPVVVSMAGAVKPTPSTRARGATVLAGIADPFGAFFTVTPASVVIEAIKRAEDGDGLIVRVYEAHGARCQAHLRTPMPISLVSECDLLERQLSPEQPDASPAYDLWQASPVASHDTPQCDADGRGWSCQVRPFEIRTFRVRI